MLDFVQIQVRENKRGSIIVYPEFITKSSKDLMIKGKDFYAYWDKDKGLWSKSQGELIELIDNETKKIVHDMRDDVKYAKYDVNGIYMEYNSTKKWEEFTRYCKNLPDNFHLLDSKVIFSNDDVKKEDYVTHTLPYPLVEMKTNAYDELMDVLYDRSERNKIEWAIGSIITGASKDIQKFYVLYGAAGSGKSTVLNIIQLLLDGYWAPFVSADLGTASKDFAMEPLKDNPLVGIEHDGNLSRIDTNTRLNSIISHESMVINEKRKSQYNIKLDTTLFVGTNSPVRITDGRSGLLRRLIDIKPSGRKLSFERYTHLMNQIPYELGGIAYKCKQYFEKYGPDKYGKYKPITMIDETNDMFNFVEEMFWEWEEDNKVSLASAWQDYKKWAEDANAFPMKKRKFKAELKEYFDEFYERYNGDYNVYVGLKNSKLNVQPDPDPVKEESWLDLKEQKSLLDEYCKDCYAQYATEDDVPAKKWSLVKTRLREIETDKVHYLKPQEAMVVIDLDKKDKDGNKNFELNKEAASKFPKTYAELSKGGAGIHLHYIYEGDVSALSAFIEDDVEIKVFTGGSALRRKLTKCNKVPIATISGGLPLKEVKKMVDSKSVESEKHLRVMIKKCLNKEHHGHTAPEMDFIKKLTDEAYADESLSYDIRDLRPAIHTFAMSSTNQAQRCFNTAAAIHYCSKDNEPNKQHKDVQPSADWEKSPIVFYDVEVFPNLFIICWKLLGDDTIIRMINPKPKEVEELFKYRLVGFNNRRYDNHIIYARSIGYSLADLFKLSQRIVAGSHNAMFGAAYNISYTDIYDFAAKKQSLKKWEIELGINHMENEYPWDEPVDEEHWDEIADYCCNDVRATEAVWHECHADFAAREILSKLTGLSVNQTTRNHITKLILEGDPNPKHNYVDLSEEFPGYEFTKGADKKYHNMYRGTDVGFGGYVYAEPGIYYQTALLDVGNMHGASIIALNKFMEHTHVYEELRSARMAIKARDYKAASKMLGGIFAPYLTSDDEADALANAIKLVLNSTYGIAAATFDNPLRDPRDKNNIIALRGALFMRTLQDEVAKRGFTVAHIKTDSIKIPNATQEIIDFCMEFGRKYGYEFEHECTYERICLVNNAVYIAKYDDKGVRNKGGKHANEWTATGAEFAHPYIYKTLFTHEPIEFKDLCETKEVKSVIYLDMNEKLPDVDMAEKEYKKVVKNDTMPEEEKAKVLGELAKEIERGHDYHFVGRIGQFTPIKPGYGGGLLVKSTDKLKYDAVTGTKGYRWLESAMVKSLNREDVIDMDYFDNLVEDAKKSIENFGSFDKFVSDEFAKFMAEPVTAVGVGEEIPF